MPATPCTSWSIKLSKFECLGSGLGDHCYKIVDDSNSKLTFGVGAYGASWGEQFSFARPFSYRHRFQESRGGTQPCGFMSVFSAANRIPVSPEPPQQSYSYGLQLSHLFSGFFNLLAVFWDCKALSLYLQSSIRVCVNYLWVFGLPFENQNSKN